MLPTLIFYKLITLEGFQGHSEKKANELLQQYGLNMLTPPKKRSELLAILKCLFAGFNFLLWFGSLASLTSYIMESHQSADAKLDNVSNLSTLIK